MVTMPAPEHQPRSDELEQGPWVAILLCTHHGQRFLAEQLDSYEAQTHAAWKVVVSDDGSTDGTRAILEEYARKWGQYRLAIHSGPQQGFTANFLSLIRRPDIEAAFFAFSDQDDVWEADKLRRAIAWLSAVPPHLPAVYCSRTRLIDSEGRDIGLSPLFARTPSFANALVQNIAGGNTMVFNAATRSLLLEASARADVVSHDWWTYQLVAGCGGRVFYDPWPSVKYRQHELNQVGYNSSWPARFRRIRMMLQGRFRQWNDRNVAALSVAPPRLTAENKALLEQFSKARRSSLLPRLLGLWKTGIHRQTLLGNFGLVAAAILKRI